MLHSNRYTYGERGSGSSKWESPMAFSEETVFGLSHEMNVFQFIKENEER
jgi:hypothetical protein